MIRSGIARKPATAREPAKGPRTLKCAAKGCMARYVPGADPRIRWCSDDCGVAVALAEVAKRRAAAAKLQRAADKRQKEATMRPADRLAMVQSLANRIAVLRDWEDGCISCDKGPHWQGQWHGSHYKSVGSNSALRFNLWNISKACADCNWHRSGNIANYVPRLKLKFGAERVEWLDNHPRSREYSPEYLTRYAAIARKWIKRREKRLGLK